MKTIITSLAFILVLGLPVSAQWAKTKDNSIPRAADGKPILTAKTPQTREGKPDLSGVWQSDTDPAGLPKGIDTVESITGLNAPRYFVDVTADLKQNEVPFQPAAAAAFVQRLQNMGKDDPTARCQPTGVPAINNIPIPFKIVQTPGLVVILYEDSSVFRQIFMDARKPVADPQPRWMGYSTGRWEGETLVVDSIGFTAKSWLDRIGHTHSEAMRVTERFRRRDLGHLEIEVTIDDPMTYTKPIKYVQKATLVADEDLLEYFCTENEKDVQHYR